jgi:dihydrofolate reductase
VAKLFTIIIVLCEMRKLIMWNIITLDGFFDGEKAWELPFHAAVWGDELEKLSLEQLRAADFLVFGRATYEGMASHWQSAEGEIAELMNKIPKLVFSRSLASAEWENSQLVKGNASDELSRIKAEGDGDMYVFGSANLSQTFIENDLFDEYRVGIAPVIMGKGRPLFGRGSVYKQLDLISSQQLVNGGMILRYR